MANLAAPGMFGHGGNTARPGPALSGILPDGKGIAATDTRREADAAPAPEARGATANSPLTATPATLPRSDMAQTVAMQIAAAVHRAGPAERQALELRLAPAELGSVRLTFTQSDSGVTVNVQAERADTLELLRRNIDTLAQDFLDIGYESANFTFDRDDTQAQDVPQVIEKDDTGTAPWRAPRAAQPAIPALVLADRIDIRL